MRSARHFYNGRTSRDEVWLFQGSVTGWWHVGSLGEKFRYYDDTDEGYAKALADYEARVAVRIAANAP